VAAVVQPVVLVTLLVVQALLVHPDRVTTAEQAAQTVLHIVMVVAVAVLVKWVTTLAHLPITVAAVMVSNLASQAQPLTTQVVVAVELPEQAVLVAVETAATEAKQLAPLIPVVAVAVLGHMDKQEKLGDQVWSYCVIPAHLRPPALLPAVQL
jgi:hypothetical protein